MTLSQTQLSDEKGIHPPHSPQLSPQDQGRLVFFLNWYHPLLRPKLLHHSADEVAEVMYPLCMYVCLFVTRIIFSNVFQV